ncbi:MAG: hypothetical protein DWB56_05375 [Candidatus Jettenia sp.]|nr:MAG: hypothetical protein EDM77_05170 [Candidatus Jettenia sp. AMX1]MBC6928385.1 hypothetical protein [Candidatus Jettenia sp.]GIL20722.1 MAG: hypothetical protein BroJett041_18360 [Candidatus Jettenia caeni]MCE7879685.1 hypothetical protein [Candidatus Jettenia sp. AMX1]MCQ3926553.1 hypothetical protein [Candidatus Jettenia sp.]
MFTTSHSLNNTKFAVSYEVLGFRSLTQPVKLYFSAAIINIAYLTESIQHDRIPLIIKNDLSMRFILSYEKE